MIARDCGLKGRCTTALHVMDVTMAVALLRPRVARPRAPAQREWKRARQQKRVPEQPKAEQRGAAPGGGRLRAG